MPRSARKYLKNPYIHIIVQGINKEYIFKENSHKTSYKTILKKNLVQTNINILAYCIMDNHVHILAHSDEVKEITKLMQKTNTSYAKLYNKKHNRVGYVFRDRYYTQMILSKNHLYNCIVYIHNNPVKANIVKDKSDYLYSSYLEYLGQKELITRKSIELVFDSKEDYLEIFNQIHQRTEIEDVADIQELKTVNEVIDEFVVQNNKSLEQIKLNEILFSKLLMKLRHSAAISLRGMSKIFNINKDKLNKIINKSIK